MNEERDYWEEDPQYPHWDWIAEVMGLNTLMGYHDWVESMREADEEYTQATT